MHKAHLNKLLYFLLKNKKQNQSNKLCIIKYSD